MSQGGEIISFQIGNYANFVGAHFFNLQDPVLNPDIGADFNSKTFWRESENLQRQKVSTPRALIFDLKDNWTDKFIQSSGNHPDPKAISAGTAGTAQTTLDKIQAGASWDGTVQRVVLPPTDLSSDSDDNSDSLSSRNVKKKDNQQDFKKWGEFAKWKLHRTDKCTYRIPEDGKFLSYGQGLEVYHEIEEDVKDGIRLYAEECDYLEGFHLLVDEYNGFSGIAAAVLEHVGDEYDKKACFGFGLNKPLSTGSDEASQKESIKDYRIRISNTAQCWSSFNRYSRVFTSFGLCKDIFVLNPSARKLTNVISDCNSPYISSSILAATLDSLTLPYRLSTPSFPLHEMTSLLNAFGHKMTMIGTSLPFPMNQQTLFRTLNENGLSSIYSLMPNANIDLDKSLGNIFVTRGINQESVISKSDYQDYKHSSIRSVDDCLQLYCQESYSKSVHVIKNSASPLKSSFPFPSLFSQSYLEAQATEKRFAMSQGNIWMLPTIASGHNTPVVGNILEKMVGVVGGGEGGSAMKLKTFYEPCVTCSGSRIEFEDYAESINDLDTLRETYSSS